jgi:hypothetical protein
LREVIGRVPAFVMVGAGFCVVDMVSVSGGG